MNNIITNLIFGPECVDRIGQLIRKSCEDGHRDIRDCLYGYFLWDVLTAPWVVRDIVLETIVYHILDVVEEGADGGTVREVTIAVYIKAVSIVELRIEVDGTDVNTVT